MRRALWIAAALAALVLPLAAGKSFYLQIVANAYITAIAVYGLNVILGYAGLLNLGNAAFFGVGAYAVALLETKLGWPFWPALAAGCAASMLLGAFVGVIGARTRGHYFAIFTAAVGVMIFTVFSNWQDLTGGNLGIVGIPPPPPIGALSFADDRARYYLVLAALALAIAIVTLARRSLAGLTFVAIADNAILARAAGIDVARARLVAFVLSTFLTGLAGGMYAMENGNLGPDASGLDVTFEQLLNLVVGGIGTIAGPLIGTLLLVGLTQTLQSAHEYRFLIFGPLLVALVIFFPHGIAGAFARVRAPRAPHDVAATATTASTAEAALP